MYNTELPDRAALPSSAQLMRSTLVAAAVAGLLLVTVVMPAEYGVDPTGVGRVLGLQAMGETKLGLAKEAGEGPAEPPKVPVAQNLPPTCRSPGGEARRREVR